MDTFTNYSYSELTTNLFKCMVYTCMYMCKKLVSIQFYGNPYWTTFVYVSSFRKLFDENYNHTFTIFSWKLCFWYTYVLCHSITHSMIHNTTHFAEMCNSKSNDIQYLLYIMSLQHYLTWHMGGSIFQNQRLSNENHIIYCSWMLVFFYIV